MLWILIKTKSGKFWEYKIIRVLLVSPISIAGELIINGFAMGFEACNCKVLKKDIRELSQECIDDFNPDFVFGYGYSYLFLEETKKLDFKEAVLIHYFADEPNSSFSYGKNPELFEELSKTNCAIFCWDKAFLNDFKPFKNALCVEYLPLAASPKAYAVDFDDYKYQISFVGRPLTEKRQKILSKIVKEFKNKLSIFCKEEHFQKSIEEMKAKGLLNNYELIYYEKCYRGSVEGTKDLAKIYNSSKINLNITEQGKTGLNYRVFEVLSSGGFLLTDYMADLDEHFIISKELEVYRNDFELIDKIKFYLENFGIAYKIAINGKLKNIKGNTFTKRCKSILEKLI